MRTSALRWVLPFVLAFAVIGMHNMVTLHAPHDSSPMPTAVAMQGVVEAASPCCTDEDHHSSGHDLLHLCLAILVALAGLVLGWLLWRRGHTATSRHDLILTGSHPGRGPPGVRLRTDLLSSLCVLRL